MIRKLSLLFISLIASNYVIASPYGLSISVPLIDKDPSPLRAYRIAALYQPENWNWEHVNVYLDASYGHWWVTSNHPYKSLSIYAFAPYLRYYLVKKPWFAPYFEASLGIAYLTKTRFDDRNLGIHFTFQDQIGMGVALGHEQQFYATLAAVHYSNGSMSGNNAGITVPLVLTAGYRF